MEKEPMLALSNEIENNIVKKDTFSSEKSKTGLTSIRAIIFLLLWYFFSACTLFLNKYILAYQNGNPTVLGKHQIDSIDARVLILMFSGACQMLMTASCGFIQLYFPCGMYKPTQRLSKPPGFYRHMVLVGCFR